MVLTLTVSLCAANFAWSQQSGVFPEQRRVQIRSQALAPVALPPLEIPYTVTSKGKREEIKLSLDEAIQLALRNAEVVRVLGGVSASSSGRTVYDVSISNTGIDQQTAVFDPTFDISSTMSKSDNPFAIFDPLDPTRSILAGSSTDSISTTLGLSKRTQEGATVGMNVNAIGSYFEPGISPLEPENRSFVELTLRKPLMRGGGRAANLAPVVIAAIDTERSWFQFKDTTQELVRSVIAGYWNLVAARVDVWAREQQIDQLKFAYDRATARLEEGVVTRAADVAQARSALASFRANLIAARSNLILTETALRNVLGLDPSSQSVLTPTSLPELDRIEFDWEEMLTMAEQHRPDIIELKLILEADRQSLLLANNQAKPQFDGIANYRWNGLSGQMPNGAFLPNEPGRFAGFNLGVAFSVPMGLRRDRAALRRQELVLMRDQANLDQGIHQMVHQLTINYRNLDQFFEQYKAFKEAREAARINFDNQAEDVATGQREFINVLQAISDWGNAVSAEASSVTRYNTELANIERQTGTILETHGVRFVEERYGSIAPSWLGLRRDRACYSKRIQPQTESDRYLDSELSSDESFNLQDLDIRKSNRKKDKPAARPKPSEAKTESKSPTATKTGTTRRLPTIELAPPIAGEKIGTESLNFEYQPAQAADEKTKRRLSDLFQ